MSVLNIREAERAGARVLIGLAGISGSGKTFSALQLAYGLANGNAKKVGLLDTENRRGSLYADCLKNKKGEVQKFLIGDLAPPFSPQRYIEAILEFQKAGVEVLVIDSISHEWEGRGGCEEIATEGNPRNPRWNDAKREHKRFMNAMLQSDMHIIAAIRAREKVKLVKRDGKTEYEPQGVMPITEKSALFEMTASLLMWNEGKTQDVMKCPQELRSILGRGEGYLSARDGLALRKWIEGGVQLDPEVEHARNSLHSVTEKGLAETEKAWKATAKPIRDALGEEFRAEISASAQSYDDARKRSANGGSDGEAAADLNAELLGNPAPAAA